MFPTLLVLLAADPRLPPECAPPPLHDVAPLKDLASLDGAFSAGLDAVATWCFDSGGNWTAGKKPPKGQRTPVDDAPAGDCAKAIVSCEATSEVVKNKAPLRDLANQAKADLDRPFRGARYVPRRSGLREHPNETADCRAKSRTELFQMAQRRMDLARLTSQIQNEYANYRTWLFARGLECRNQVVANKKDPTKRNLGIDEGSAAAAAATADAGTTVASAAVPAGAGTVSNLPEVKLAVQGDWLPKWKLFARLQSQNEADRDYTLGFLSSREVKGCDCQRVNPAALARSIEKKEGGEAGMGLLREEDAVNTRCELCMLDVFSVWRARATKSCEGMDALSDDDFDKLRKSDEAAGIPPRCFEESSARRTARVLAEAERQRAEAERQKELERQRALAASPKGAGGAGQGGVAGTAGAGGTAVAHPGTGGAGGTSVAQPGTGTGGAAVAHPGTGGATGTTGTGVAPAVGGTAVAAGSAGSTGGASGASATGTGGNAGTGGSLQTIGGYTYYRPSSAGAGGAAGTTGGTGTAGTTPGATGGTAGTGTAGAMGGTAGANTARATPGATGAPLAAGQGSAGVTGPGTPTGPGVAPTGAYDSFMPPQQWAPVPQREDGRIYVRLFMSSACEADIEPGPLQARTGDLLLLPWEAHYVQVRSPCGGLAEVYFGREPKPRVSELFGKSKPLRFEFKRQ